MGFRKGRGKTVRTVRNTGFYAGLFRTVVGATVRNTVHTVRTRRRFFCAFGRFGRFGRSIAIPFYPYGSTALLVVPLTDVRRSKSGKNNVPIVPIVPRPIFIGFSNGAQIVPTIVPTLEKI